MKIYDIDVTLEDIARAQAHRVISGSYGKTNACKHNPVAYAITRATKRPWQCTMMQMFPYPQPLKAKRWLSVFFLNDAKLNKWVWDWFENPTQEMDPLSFKLEVPWED